MIQTGELSDCGGAISLGKCLQCGFELQWQIGRCRVMTKMDNLSSPQTALPKAAPAPKARPLPAKPRAG